MSRDIFRGIFYFKKTSNGNLFGEYTNLDMDEVAPESASRKASTTESKATAESADPWGFCGEYASTWYESKSVGEHCTLSIRAEVAMSSKYVLQWINSDKKIRFEGTGMICDGILIGEYH